jgi:hypothetical protein
MAAVPPLPTVRELHDHRAMKGYRRVSVSYVFTEVIQEICERPVLEFMRELEWMNILY